MSLSDSDLTKLLQVQLSIQVAVTTLLEGQRKIVEMIMTMCQKEKGKFPQIKRCNVRIKRLKLPKHCFAKKKVKASDH